MLVFQVDITEEKLSEFQGQNHTYLWPTHSILVSSATHKIACTSTVTWGLHTDMHIPPLNIAQDPLNIYIFNMQT